MFLRCTEPLDTKSIRMYSIPNTLATENVMWALCSQPFANNLLLQNFNLRFRLKSLLFQTQVKMVSSGADRPLDPLTNPKVTKLQELVNERSADGWEKSWEQRQTPWDLGQPTPVILHLLQTGALPKGRALIPGCGSGYDVVAIASPERYVVGLDIADSAIEKAREEGNVLLRANCIIFICSPARGAQLDAFLLVGFGYMISSSAPNADYFTFFKADFFTWQPRDLFDLIFDYTLMFEVDNDRFFCAIEPGLRPSWGRCVRDLLKPEGELITLKFPISDHKGGPPYKVSLADYEEVLHPMGFEAISVIDNELAVGPRKGREKLGRWKRSLKQSLL